MIINLYREDGYSLWALLKRFPDLLLALGDHTSPEDARIVVFYRPSFGRADSQPKARKQFGEFDLLIGTPEGVYPIECKPERCGELDQATLVMTLREEQIRRHSIFRTYRMLWQKYRPSGWNDFRTIAIREFQAAHPNWTMAEQHNLLGVNLEFVLRSLEQCGDKIQDTILLFHESGKKIVFTHADGFTCITMSLEMVTGSNFVSVEVRPRL